MRSVTGLKPVISGAGVAIWTKWDVTKFRNSSTKRDKHVTTVRKHEWSRGGHSTFICPSNNHTHNVYDVHPSCIILEPKKQFFWTSFSNLPQYRNVGLTRQLVVKMSKLFWTPRQCTTPPSPQIGGLVALQTQTHAVIVSETAVFFFFT